MIIRRESGARVGWVTTDDREEAEQLADEAAKHAARMVVAGYDFGFQSPGQIRENNDGTFTVTTP